MATTNPNARLQQDNCIKWNGPIDTDGIQLCPALPASGPWGLTRCAFQQATSFHEPTQAEKKSMAGLIDSFQAKDSAGIVSYADQLNLRVCRVKKGLDGKQITTVSTKPQALSDSYLIAATKPGVKNYSGPFFLYRELNPSNYIGVSPHDGSDGTCPTVQQVFDRTHMGVLLSNGQKKTLATQKAPCTTNRPISDTAHAINNLAWTAFTKMANDNPDYMFLEFHGMKGTQQAKPGAPKGIGMIITNGLGRQAGPNSLLYAFAQAVANRFQNRNQNFKDTLTVCAPGTPLSYRQKCNLRDTWVQGRFLNHSKGAQCNGSEGPSNRFVGFEQGMKLVKDPDVMTPVIEELEKTYPKPKPV